MQNKVCEYCGDKIFENVHGNTKYHPECKRSAEIEREKNRIKVHVHGLLARATRMIDSYPDHDATSNREYHDSSHKTFLDWRASTHTSSGVPRDRNGRR